MRSSRETFLKGIKTFSDAALPDFDAKLNKDSFKINKELPKDEVLRLISLISKYKHIFLWSKSTISKVHGVKYFIPIGIHPPVQKRQYPIPTVA